MDGQQAAAILGVAQWATRDELRRAFRARAKSLHPDAGSGGSTERFIELRLAFDRLIAEAPATEVSRRLDGYETDAPRSAGSIDLTDTTARRPRRTATVAAVGSAGAASPTRDARGLTFADHLAAALTRA